MKMNQRNRPGVFTNPSRRSFLRQLAVAGAVGGAVSVGPRLSADERDQDTATADPEAYPIVDTHQHLWNLQKLTLPWLQRAPAVLKRDYGLQEYAEATAGLNVIQAVYMEVDVTPEHHLREARAVIEICRQADNPTVAAVISGRPGSAEFEEYIRGFREFPEIRGVRQVLHSDSAPQRMCLEPQFVASMRLLGDLGMSFDLCMRPGELGDAIELVRMCPQTQFILDHCGNAAPAAFLPGPTRRGDLPHDPEKWKRDIAAMAECENVICKISGVIASAPADIPFAESLAPIVNHCLDQFGPERVVFGGDWPVCLLGGSYADWVLALRQIVADRSAEFQEKLWFRNAQRYYRLPVHQQSDAP